MRYDETQVNHTSRDDQACVQIMTSRELSRKQCVANQDEDEQA